MEPVETIEGKIGENVKRVVNFRDSSLVENFYRFLSDNDLRREAKIMLETVYKRLNTVNKKKRRGRSKKVLH